MSRYRALSLTYSSYNGSFGAKRKKPLYFFSKNVLHTAVILLPRITIVSGHMIKRIIDLVGANMKGKYIYFGLVYR